MIINTAIKESILKLLPMKYILNLYLKDEEIKEHVLNDHIKNDNKSILNEEILENEEILIHQSDKNIINNELLENEINHQSDKNIINENLLKTEYDNTISNNNNDKIKNNYSNSSTSAFESNVYKNICTEKERDPVLVGGNKASTDVVSSLQQKILELDNEINNDSETSLNYKSKNEDNYIESYGNITKKNKSNIFI